MMPIPLPDEGDVPIQEAAQVALNPGEKVTVTMTPETSGSQHKVPIVAITKRKGSSYEIAVDGTNRFGPSPIPPTDIDDVDATFIPALDMQSKLETEIKDLRASGGERTYFVQVIGWEA